MGGSGHDHVVCPVLSPVYLVWLDSELLCQASDPWVPPETAEDAAPPWAWYVDGEQSSRSEISGCRPMFKSLLGWSEVLPGPARKSQPPAFSLQGFSGGRVTCHMAPWMEGKGWKEEYEYGPLLLGRMALLPGGLLGGGGVGWLGIWGTGGLEAEMQE